MPLFLCCYPERFSNCCRVDFHRTTQRDAAYASVSTLLIMHWLVQRENAACVCSEWQVCYCLDNCFVMITYHCLITAALYPTHFLVSPALCRRTQSIINNAAYWQSSVTLGFQVFISWWYEHAAPWSWWYIVAVFIKMWFQLCCCFLWLSQINVYTWRDTSNMMTRDVLASSPAPAPVWWPPLVW